MKNHAVVLGGAGPNIGSAITRRLSAGGWEVTVLDVDREAGDCLVQELTPVGTVRFAYADATSSADLQREISVAFDSVSAGDGAALVVSVGGSPAPPRATDTTEEDFEATVRLNLTSAFLATTAAIPKFDEIGGGSVVYLSSANSLFGWT